MSDQQKKMFFASLNPDKDGLQFADTAGYMAHLGHNSGNTAFVYAVGRHLQGARGYIAASSLPPERLSEHYRLIVFPAANNIGEKTDLGWFANIIEKSGLPFLVVGIGAQADFNTQKLNLPPGTLRFVDIVRERKVPIGVRGEFTASLLADFGVDTAKVVGCPSNFLNPKPNLGEIIADKLCNLDAATAALALNLEYFRLESQKVQRLVSWVRRSGGSVVFQSDAELFSYIRRDYAGPPNKMSWAAKYFTGEPNVHAFRRFLVQFGRIYTHVPSWMDYLRTVDLSLGSRFHGNMLAFQAETPAIIFPHDTRTKELCQAIELPAFEWERFNDTTTLADILEETEFDGAQYDRNRRRLATDYISILQSFDVSIAKSLLDSVAAGDTPSSSVRELQ